MGKKKAAPEGAPLWMVTYGDMMSLLFCFFVMLHTLSSLDQTKVQPVVQAFRKQFGYNPAMYVPIPGARFEMSQQHGSSNQSNFAQEGNPVKPTLSMQDPKEKVNSSYIRFAPGSEELDDEAKKHLDSIVPELQGRPQKIELKGRSSQGEKKGPYRSDMDISYARAYKVREYLIEKGIKSTRIELNTVGVNDPISESLDPSPTANCSVEISLLSEKSR